MDYSRFPRNDVLCIDMRSFYASIEAVKRGLDPMKATLAVVGNPDRSGSVVLAASPTLKEKHGIRNVSRFFELPKNDPNLIIAPAHMKDYLKVSIAITKLLLNFVPKEAIHQYSVDEVWITVNGLKEIWGTPYEIASKIKREILECFGITCSIGIGDNKFLAKVVMDIYAKKEGISECRYEDVSEILWPVSIEKIWGIGSRMAEKLNQVDTFILGELAHMDLNHLKKRFGIMGEQLYWHAWGIDLSPVYGNFIKTEQKGFGHGITLLRDYTDKDIAACILDLCEDVCRRARLAKKIGKTIHLGISYSKETAGGFSRSKSITTPTNLTKEMFKTCMELFERFYDGHSYIRRVYVTLANISNDACLQLDLFSDRSKQKDLTLAIDTIKEKYGPTIILRGSSYTKGGVAIERGKKIGGHYL